MQLIRFNVIFYATGSSNVLSSKKFKKIKKNFIKQI